MAHRDPEVSHQEGLGWWEMSFLSSHLPWWFRALQMVYPDGDRGTEALAAALGRDWWSWQGLGTQGHIHCTLCPFSPLWDGSQGNKMALQIHL